MRFVVPAVTAAGLLVWLAGQLHWAARQPLWLVLGAYFGVVTSSYAVDRFYEGCTRWQFHTRVATKTAGVTFCLYLTGWGPMLMGGLFYLVADTLENFGASSMLPALMWATAAVAAGQAAIELRLAPSMVRPPIVHGLAVLALASLVAAAVYLRLAVIRRDEAHRAVAEQQQRFQALVQHSSDFIMLLDAEGWVRYASPSALGFLDGRAPASKGQGLPSTKTMREWVHPDDVPVLDAMLGRVLERPGKAVTDELRALDSSGSWHWLELVTSNLLDVPGVRGLVVNARVVTDRKYFEAELAVRATTDPLTGLGNRSLFRERLEHALSRQVREQTPLAVLFVDVDHFKDVNDRLGHSAGDELLVALAERLTRCLREEDTLARLGGDEFTILLEQHCSSPEEMLSRASSVASRVNEDCREPLALRGEVLQVTVSIGIALCEAGQSAQDVLQHADLAMYRAKELGRDRSELFEAASLARDPEDALPAR